MKIVIISRCIYPQIAPRPFRATELAKYFAKEGHDVTLYAVLGHYDYTEFCKNTGIKVKNLGPMRYATTWSDIEPNKTSILAKILTRLFHNLLEFPDVELVGKTINAIKAEKNVDLLITIAVPYPIHWGAARAKKLMGTAFPKVWVSDCGDPYMGNSIVRHPSYFQWVEDYWGEKTDYITIPIEEARMGYSKKVQAKIRVIPQGLNFEAFKIDENFKGNNIPHFAYAGVTNVDYRNPTKFLEYLTTIDKDFRFYVYTKAAALFEPFQEKLGEKLIVSDYIPREVLIYKLSQMDFVINILNPSAIQSPSKLIDYYLTKRPILDISSSFNEQTTFNAFMDRDYSKQHIVENADQYRIENVGKAFGNLVDKKQFSQR